MIRESYSVNASTAFDIDIVPAPADGKKYPIVVLVHGNFGLVEPFGSQLRSFTNQMAALGFLAALPSYYDHGIGQLTDANIDSHVPALVAAIKHLAARADADPARLGLVGFSLGGGISMSYINASPVGSVSAFANFYGYVSPKLHDGVMKFPPTILFHNKNDGLVPPNENSERLADALKAAGKVHEPDAPYVWYDEHWELGKNHAFKPGGLADIDSRDRTGKWLKKYMPPVGKP